MFIICRNSSTTIKNKSNILFILYIFVEAFLRAAIIHIIKIITTEKLLTQILHWAHQHFQNISTN